MRAKTEARERARHLRSQGRTYDEIQAELGVSKSSISLWVRDLPRPDTTKERARKAAETRWGPYRERVTPSAERSRTRPPTRSGW